MDPQGRIMTENNANSASLVGPGLLLVVATAIISGVSTFVNLYAVKGTNSDAFVTVRNLAVALLLVPIAILGARSAHLKLRGYDYGRLLAIGFIGGAVPFLLFFHGLQLATQAGGGATASFFYRTLFLMATVLGVVALGERFNARVAIAAGLLLAGNLLLLSLTTPILNDGTIYVIAATALWAVEYSVSKWTLRDLPSSTVALGRMGFGAIFLVGYLGLTAQVSAVGALSGAQWEWVGISAVLLFAFVATWYAGLKRVDLSTAAAVLVAGFPITWMLTVTVQGSSISVDAALGAAAVVAGVVLAIGTGLLRATASYLASAVGSRRPGSA